MRRACVEHERAQAFAPADVTAELDSATRQMGHAQDAGARSRRRPRTPRPGRRRGAGPGCSRERLARLAGSRRGAPGMGRGDRRASGRGRAAERELRARGLAERIPVTDAEVAAASAAERETPAIDPAVWAAAKGEQTAQVEADAGGPGRRRRRGSRR